jgi:hypothetical protein
MINGDDDRVLDRLAASEKLEEWFGKPGAVKPKTLAKLACVGGGPPMIKFGRKVGYAEKPLYGWGRSRARIVKSTSDHGEGA